MAPYSVDGLTLQIASDDDDANNQMPRIDLCAVQNNNHSEVVEILSDSESLPKLTEHNRIWNTFGWTIIGCVKLPYITRNKDIFLSVRMLEAKLLSRFPRVFASELDDCKLRSSKITFSEARILNEININQCAYEYGIESFTETDIIVRVDEFEVFYERLNETFPEEVINSLVLGIPIQPPKNIRIQDYGWLQINNTIIPYIRRVHRKYTLVTVLMHAAGLMTDDNFPTEVLSQVECKDLNLICNSCGFDYQFQDYIKLVDIDVVKMYHNIIILELPCENPAGHVQNGLTHECLRQFKDSYFDNSLRHQQNISKQTQPQHALQNQTQLQLPIQQESPLHQLQTLLQPNNPQQLQPEIIKLQATAEEVQQPAQVQQSSKQSVLSPSTMQQVEQPINVQPLAQWLHVQPPHSIKQQIESQLHHLQTPLQSNNPHGLDQELTKHQPLVEEVQQPAQVQQPSKQSVLSPSTMQQVEQPINVQPLAQQLHVQPPHSIKQQIESQLHQLQTPLQSNNPHGLDQELTKHQPLVEEVQQPAQVQQPSKQSVLSPSTMQQVEQPINVQPLAQRLHVQPPHSIKQQIESQLHQLQTPLQSNNPHGLDQELTKHQPLVEEVQQPARVQPSKQHAQSPIIMIQEQDLLQQPLCQEQLILQSLSSHQCQSQISRQRYFSQEKSSENIQSPIEQAKPAEHAKQPCQSNPQQLQYYQQQQQQQQQQNHIHQHLQLQKPAQLMQQPQKLQQRELQWQMREVQPNVQRVQTALQSQQPPHQQLQQQDPHQEMFQSQIPEELVQHLPHTWHSQNQQLPQLRKCIQYNSQTSLKQQPESHQELNQLQLQCRLKEMNKQQAYLLQSKHLQRQLQPSWPKMSQPQKMQTLMKSIKRTHDHTHSSPLTQKTPPQYQPMTLEPSNPTPSLYACDHSDFQSTHDQTLFGRDELSQRMKRQKVHKIRSETRETHERHTMSTVLSLAYSIEQREGLECRQRKQQLQQEYAAPTLTMGACNNYSAQMTQKGQQCFSMSSTRGVENCAYNSNRYAMQGQFTNQRVNLNASEISNFHRNPSMQGRVIDISNQQLINLCQQQSQQEQFVEQWKEQFRSEQQQVCPQQIQEAVYQRQHQQDCLVQQQWEAQQFQKQPYSHLSQHRTQIWDKVGNNLQTDWQSQQKYNTNRARHKRRRKNKLVKTLSTTKLPQAEAGPSNAVKCDSSNVTLNTDCVVQNTTPQFMCIPHDDDLEDLKLSEELKKLSEDVLELCKSPTDHGHEVYRVPDSKDTINCEEDASKATSSYIKCDVLDKTHISLA